MSESAKRSFMSPTAYERGSSMSATANLPALPSSLTPEGNLSRYLQEIRKFPLLEPQQEFMLAKRWREHGESNAAHQLVTSHLRLVAKNAIGYPGHGLPGAA